MTRIPPPPELDILDVLEPVPGTTATVAPQPDVDDLESDVPERDRIVILGRRQSGKTIYLASIYAQLWRSVDGLTAKALTGEVHRQLMSVHQMLRDSQWPPSTLGTTQVDLELEYHGKRRLLVALDFAGELFSKAFLHEQSDWPGVKELVKHIDRAAAVLLLVDPAVVAGMDKHAAMEDDFGMVQAAQRIRNWAGGERVPIVLVLTKMDQNQELLDRAGGPLQFVRAYFPALLRQLKEMPVVQVSAVQTERAADGKVRPKRESTPINLDHPLRFCLRELEKNERRQELDRIEEQRRAAEAVAMAESHLLRRKAAFRTLLLTCGIAALGVIVGVLILAFSF